MISEIKKRLDGLLNLLEQMAGGDLKVRMPLTPARDEIDALAFGINLLADEVQFKQTLEERRRSDLEDAQAKLQSTLQELQKTQDQLLQSAKLAALGELCAGMAHEINNPLTVIRGYFEQMEIALERDGKIEGAIGRTSLEKIGRNINRIVELIKTVKDFSRQSNIDLKPLNLAELMDSCLGLLEPQFNLRRIQVHRRYGNSAVPVLGDATRLEQVFINILTNAMDAIESAHSSEFGNINVSLVDGTQYVRIEVRDDGIGLDPALSEKIFDPFFTTKEVGRGTGLGLSISHRIVKDHNGTIELSSGPGAGTTVRIELPSAQPGTK